MNESIEQLKHVAKTELILEVQKKIVDAIKNGENFIVVRHSSILQEMTLRNPAFNGRDHNDGTYTISWN